MKTYKFNVLLYLVIITSVVIISWGCATIHPADMKYNTEVVNSKNYKPHKIKYCNGKRI
jgi:hypothetical protein